MSYGIAVLELTPRQVGDHLCLRVRELVERAHDDWAAALATHSLQLALADVEGGLRLVEEAEERQRR